MVLPVPSTVGRALRTVGNARDHSRERLYQQLVPAAPQPANDFCTLLAVPTSLKDACIVCFDLRHIDGRLFCELIPDSMNRESLLLAAGFPVSSDTEVYVGDTWVPLANGQWTRLWAGLTVSFRLAGRIFWPGPSLQALLLRVRAGDAPPDIPVSSHGRNAWLLTDGMPVLFDLNTASRDHFRRDVAAALSTTIDRISVQPALPMIRDIDYRGRLCERISIVTEQVSRIPVPPGRVQLPRSLYFFDKRPVLQGITWGFAVRGRLCVNELIRDLAEAAPRGYYVVVSGGVLEHQWDQSFIHVHSGQVLIAQFIADVPDSEVGSDGDDPEDPWDPRDDWSDQSQDDHENDLDDNAQHPHEELNDAQPPATDVPGRLGYAKSGNLSADQRSRYPAVWMPQKPRCFWLRIMLFAVCIQCCAAVHSHGHGISCQTDPPYSHFASARGTGAVIANNRPVATPCRTRARTPGRTADKISEAVQLPRNIGSPHRFPKHQDTTLELALAQPDCVAMALARATLDTLQEHWEAKSHRCCIELERCLPAKQAEDQAQPPYLATPAPGAQVFFGTTPLGFTWNQLWTLAYMRPQLKAWHADHLELGAWHSQLLSSVESAVATYPGFDLLTFTDGSYTPAKDASTELAGWAFIAIQGQGIVVETAHGTVPHWFLGKGECLSAYIAECYALTLAMLTAAVRWPDMIIAFVSDCVSALNGAAGRFSCKTGGAAQTMSHVADFRKSVCKATDSFCYVPGHQGQFFNEAADCLAKIGAKMGNACCFDVTDCQLQLWLSQGAPALPWAALTLCQIQGDAALPQICQSDLGRDSFHAGLSASDLIRPFLPYADAHLEVHDSTEHDNGALYLRLLSFNTLSLGACLEEDSGVGTENVGLHQRPARAALLARQLDELSVSVAALQETRCPQGRTKIGGFLRFAGGADRGQHGTELWFKEHHFALKSSSQTLAGAQFVEGCFCVCHTDPRRIMVRFFPRAVCSAICSIACPTSGT